MQNSFNSPDIDSYLATSIEIWRIKRGNKNFNYLYWIWFKDSDSTAASEGCHEKHTDFVPQLHFFPANSVKRGQLVEKIHQWRTRHLNPQTPYFPLRHKQLCPLPLLYPLRNVGSGIRGCVLKENLTKHLTMRIFFFTGKRISCVGCLCAC